MAEAVFAVPHVRFYWNGIGCLFRSFVRMFIFIGREGGGFDFLFLIFCPNVYFHWARGANARGEPKEEGGNSQARIPPSPLGFPRTVTPVLRSSLSSFPSP